MQIGEERRMPNMGLCDKSVEMVPYARRVIRVQARSSWDEIPPKSHRMEESESPNDNCNIIPLRLNERKNPENVQEDEVRANEGTCIILMETT